MPCIQMLNYGIFIPIQVFKHEVQHRKSALLCPELCINFLLLHKKLPLAQWLKTTQNYYLTVSVPQESGTVSLFTGYFMRTSSLAVNAVFDTHLSPALLNILAQAFILILASWSERQAKFQLNSDKKIIIFIFE